MDMRKRWQGSLYGVLKAQEEERVPEKPPVKGRQESKWSLIAQW